MNAHMILWRAAFEEARRPEPAPHPADRKVTSGLIRPDGMSRWFGSVRFGGSWAV